MVAAEMKPLTYKERAFGDFFVSNGFVGWRAAESAGYLGSKETLYVRASENLAKPHVRAYIESKMDEMILDPDQAMLEMSSIAKGEAAYYVNEDGSIDVEGLKESGLIRNIESVRTRHHTSARTDGSSTETVDHSVKLLNRKGALQDVLKVYDKIKPQTVIHVIGFDEALEKAYGTGEKKDE